MAESLPPFGVWSGRLALLPAAEARRLVRGWEQAGAGVVWISEAFAKEVLSHAATLLAATETLIVATGIASIHARDPVAANSGARTLAEAFGGRFVLGLGVSHRELVDRRGGTYSGPLEAMRAYLDEMDAARWQGPEVAPPLRLIAALGDRMLRLGAERAGGVHPYKVTPAHTAHARELLGAGPVIATEQAAVLATDPEVARAVARTHLATYLGLDNYRRSFLRQGFDPADLEDGGSDRLVDGIVAWGDPDAVAARLAEHRDAGADHVAVQILPADEDEDAVASVRAVLSAL